MSMPSKSLFLVGVAALFLAGCAGFEEMSKKIAASGSRAEEAVAQQNQMRKTGAVVRMSGAKLAGKEVPVKVAGQLPPVFTQNFSYLSAHQPLSAILGEIGRRTGLGTAIQPSDTPSSSGAGSTGTPGGSAMLPGQIGLPNFTGGPNAPIAVDWSGDLKGLLDYLAATTKMFWKFEDGRIHFFKTETRTFHVFLPGGKRSVRSSVSLTGNTGGSSGGSAANAAANSSGTVNVTSDMEIDTYDAIVKSVQAMVSTAEGTSGATAGSSTGSGSSRNVVSNPSLGIITVTATPAILDRVTSYIKGVNERFAQNVMIAVKIYNVTVTKDLNAGATLSLAYRDLTRKYGSATLTGMPQLKPLGSTYPGTFVIDAVPGSRWSGSQLLVQALEQLGDVQYVTSGQVIAANGQPSPLQVATNKNYVSERKYTAAATIGGQDTVEIKTSPLTLGFTANFLPLILGDNRILLQYQINLSSLISMEEFEKTVQLPTTSTQSLQQQAFVKDGQSIVLLGFEQERATVNKLQGLTGINRNALGERNLMVIVMEVYSGK